MFHKSKAEISTKYGDFVFCAYKDGKGLEHLALVKGNVRDKDGVFCRLHSVCIAGDVFHSSECSCGSELESAMEICEKEGRGVIIWMSHGSMADYFKNFKEMIGKKTARDFRFASDILNDLGIKSIRLMTKNAEKIRQLESFGISVDGWK